MNIGLYQNQILFDRGDIGNFHFRRRRKKVFRPRINFDLHPIDCRDRFRLTNDHVRMVDDRIGFYVQHDTDRNFALTSSQQIKLALRFLATGDNYRTIADSHGVSRATVSRAVHRVVTAVNEHLFPEVVDWPRTIEQIQGIANEFLDKGGMPCVFGCVDGSHVDIISPSRDDEPQFINRHSNHSINAMLVCGPKLRFYYVDTRWPGAVHDSRVFTTSTLCRRLETGWRPLPRGVLLGDSAYADKEYLISPILNPQNAREERYNRRHRSTRRFIECAIGVLKQRFRCLLRRLHLDPEFAAAVTQCCVSLHNLVMDDDDAADELVEFDRRWQEGDDHDYGEAFHRGDRTRRNELMNLL